MNCTKCGAALDIVSTSVKCPYCRTLNQLVPVVLAHALSIETISDAE